jgi:O-antigen ligase
MTMVDTETASALPRFSGGLPDAAPSRVSTIERIERVVIYIGVFLVPFANLRMPQLFFTLSDLFFCLSLVILVISGRIPNRPLEAATPTWLLAFTLLFVGLMASSILRGTAERGLIVTVQYLFSYLILLIVLVRKDAREAHRLAAIFLAAIVIVDIHGIYTFYTVGYVPSGEKGVVTGGNRLATVLRNPNLAAAINALAMPILLYFWASGRAKTFIALPVISVFLVTIVLTSSNSGLILAVLSLIVFTAFVVTTRLLLRAVIAVTILGAVFMMFGGTALLPNTFHKRVLSALSSGDVSEAGTLISRAKLMEEAVEVISQDRIVLVGLGADQFRERSVQEAPVHNLYLLLWVEGGLLALVGWIMFSGVGVLIWFALRRAGGGKPALGAVATTVAVFLTIAMFNPHMYARYWTAPVLLSFALGLAELRRVNQLKSQLVA